jgi:hypothetical protein
MNTVWKKGMQHEQGPTSLCSSSFAGGCAQEYYANMALRCFYVVIRCRT